jgi:hypothetical protein
MKKGVPATPQEVVQRRELLKVIPADVVDIWNEMIETKWDGQRAWIEQTEIVNLLVQRLEVQRQALFNNGWLDVEDLFRAAGWKVVYDSPAYCETYEPSFTFSKK